MSARTEPPFRADHVGSLLRPQRLLQAREDHAAGQLDADDATLLDTKTRATRVGREHGAVIDGVANVFEHEPLGIPHLRVVVARPADEPLGIQARHFRQHLVAAEQPPARQRLAHRQPVVQREPDGDLPLAAARTSINRYAELERLDEMRRIREQALALVQRLVHEPELGMLEVPQPAMNQPRRSAARAAADIAALDNQHLEARDSRLARNRRAIDPGPNDD